MLDATGLSRGATQFLASQRFAALSGRDHDGVLWVSPLSAQPGFLRGADDTVRIAAAPRPGDSLHQIATGQQVGLIAIDFPTRRRMRVNGVLVQADSESMTVRVDQAYGN